MGIVLGSFGAFQGNIWSVAPFIPVGPGEKTPKTRFLKKPQSYDFFETCSKFP